MSYCHKCGKQTKEEDDFCEFCGAKLREFVRETEREVKKVVKESKGHGFAIFVVVILIAYIVLDIWAATQLQPEVSLNSLSTAIANANANVGMTSASASTSLTFDNPTIIPVFLFPISYDAGYGSTQVAKGSTGIIFIPPNSSGSFPVSVEVSYGGTAVAFLSAISDAFSGNKQSSYLNFYELGIKFASYKS